MALTQQVQIDAMFILVVGLDVAPGRTIFNEVVTPLAEGTGTLADLANTVAEHPFYNDNTIGEYPISQTNEQFANEWATRLLGERGVLVDNASWDEAVSVIVGELNGGTGKADLILAAANYLQGSVAAPYQAAADWVANKVDLALHQAGA